MALLVGECDVRLGYWKGQVYPAISVNIIAVSFLSIWGNDIVKFKNYIRMSVSLLLSLCTPLKVHYGVQIRLNF